MAATHTKEWRCDDAAGFRLRVIADDGGDFWLAILPVLADLEASGKAPDLYDACYGVDVRIRAPMHGGGGHPELWHALAQLMREPGATAVPDSAAWWRDVARKLADEYNTERENARNIWRGVGQAKPLQPPLARCTAGLGPKRGRCTNVATMEYLCSRVRSSGAWLKRCDLHPLANHRDRRPLAQATEAAPHG